MWLGIVLSLAALLCVSALTADERLLIVSPNMLPRADAGNINGPSLIRAPDWLARPLGRYYLYFSHHIGKHINLAFADDLRGPWRVHTPGVLQLSELHGCRRHVASPDVHVVDKKIRVYFHCTQLAPANDQQAFVVESDDGLTFSTPTFIPDQVYMRAFQHDGWWYSVGDGGMIYRSPDGLTGWQRGGNPFPGRWIRNKTNFKEPGPRHFAVHRPSAKHLWLYYSNVGDTPERIFRAHVHIDNSSSWRLWRADAPEEVLRPLYEWEGAQLPARKSEAGPAHVHQNALRDPYIFTDDEDTYLLYSVAGEHGIGLTLLPPLLHYSANRFVSAALLGQRQPHPSIVRWLHIPKTGASFFNTLLHYCSVGLADDVHLQLNEDPRDFKPPPGALARCHLGDGDPGDHVPFARSASNKFWVTFVREPSTRLRSAFEYGGHCSGFRPLEARAVKELPTLRQFATYPGIAGCQTRMLAGVGGCAGQLVAQQDVAAAIDHLRQSFAFVGITDRWAESICLFHAMYGGTPLPVEFHNAKPTAFAKPKSGQLRSVSQEEVDAIRQVDDKDEQVYRYALNWFEEQLSMHRQQTNACVHKIKTSTE